MPRTQGNRGAHDDLDDECEDNGDGLGSGDVILNDLCYRLILLRHIVLIPDAPLYGFRYAEFDFQNSFHCFS